MSLDEDQEDDDDEEFSESPSRAGSPHTQPSLFDQASTQDALLEVGDPEELSELGDLSDVPPAYLREVVELLRSLPSPEDDPGGLDQMRSWIRTLAAKSGFSREVTLQLMRAIAQTMEADRPKGYGQVSRTSLQEAFVRIGGVREMVNVMLMRLADPAVVAAVCRVVTASVTGAPLAAEALHNDGADKLRLILRAVERHYPTSLDVAEQGCLLVSHLCAPLPRAGQSANPVRGKAHRESQHHLASAGTIDLVVEMLGSAVVEVKELSAHTERLQAKAAESAGPQVATRHGNKMSESVMRVKANIELRQAWVNLNTLEATAGRVQDVALQALILMGFGNEEIMRMLAGQLWAWAATQESAMKAGVVGMLAKKEKTDLKKGVMGPAAAGRHALGQMRRGAFKLSAFQPPNSEFELPSGEERCSLSTFEGFTKCCSLLLEVLKGRAARDRPQLAAKACRLLSALSDHHTVLLGRIDHNRRIEKDELEANAVGKAPVPEDNRQPKAPFAPLTPVLQAVMTAVRTHKQNAPFLSDAMSLLKHIKDMAMMSAPAGVATNSDTLMYAWQRVMAEAEEQDELAYAKDVMIRAVETTDTGNARCKVQGVTADTLEGDAHWLTPRMRDAVASAVPHAAELSGDALASRWSQGDPVRRKRRVEALKIAGDQAQQDRVASKGKRMTTKSKDSARSTSSTSRMSNRRTTSKEATSAKGGIGRQQSKASRRSSKAPSDAPSSPASSTAPSFASAKGGRGRSIFDRDPDEPKYVRENPRGSTEVPRLLAEALQTLHEGTPQATGVRAQKKRGAFLAQSVKDLQKGLKQGAGDAQEGPEWLRALGYGVHDEADFDRVWRQPLHEVLDRSLSMPAVGSSKKDAADGRPSLLSDAALLGEGVPPHAGLDIQLVRSEPGLLKTRVFVQPQDKFHQNASDLRVKQLLDGDFASSMVTQSLSKTLRKNGCLLPEYGVQVVFKRGRRDFPGAMLGSGGGSTPLAAPGSAMSASHMSASRSGLPSPMPGGPVMRTTSSKPVLL